MANVSDKNPADDNDDWTPLHDAAGNGHVETCKMILENMQDKNPADYYGSTPLGFAVQQGHTEICQIIINELDDAPTTIIIAM